MIKFHSNYYFYFHHSQIAFILLIIRNYSYFTNLHWLKGQVVVAIDQLINIKNGDLNMI